VIPDCPNGLPHLLSGYSYLQSAHPVHGVATQDLGSVGSCLIHFTASTCAGTDCESYWLSSNITTTTSLTLVELRKTISRCSVCQLTSSVLTLHSMNSDLPSCPQGWSILWNGYSFISVSISPVLQTIKLHEIYLQQSSSEIIQAGVQSLSSTGSCIKRSPTQSTFIKCSTPGDCEPMAEHTTQWLTSRAGTYSRCSVCNMDSS